MPWMRGRRPAWLIRLGLFMYDHLGGRKILPATRSLDLRDAPEGAPLQDRFETAFEYSDCWVEDARLVSLNARDTAERGAQIFTRTRVISATRADGLWVIRLEDTETGETTTRRARGLVNAGGPWVGNIIHDVTHIDSTEGVRLVRGSHIVTRKLFDHDKCYFFQGTDGRIIFAIPYETDFTLIGTTDADHPDPAQKPECTPEEQDYLCDFASQYFKRPVTRDDIVWTYSGVRPLYDDGAKSATAATRDYVLKMDENGAPLLNIFGGKITTYRRLAQSAVDRFAPFFPGMAAQWTAGAALAGGDFAVDGVEDLINTLLPDYPFLDRRWAQRLVRAYGTDASRILGDAKRAEDLGRDFGATLTETEVRWLMIHEFAQRADDVVWRRSKLGLRMSTDEIKALDDWMRAHPVRHGATAAAAE